MSPIRLTTGIFRALGLSWRLMRKVAGGDLVVDLGADTTRIFVYGRGVTLNEPSALAVRARDGHIVAVGRTAKLLIGRAPASIRLVRPIRNGVIADVDAAAKMLAIFIRRAMKPRLALFGPRLLFCVPAEITPVQQWAYEEVGRLVGAFETRFIEEPFAAAAGVGITIGAARASLIVDIGAATLDIAVIGSGAVIKVASWRTGGQAMDLAIAHSLRVQRGLEVGEETAEAIKKSIGSVAPNQSQRVVEVCGRSLQTGLPTRAAIGSVEVRVALSPVIAEIARAVVSVLEVLPPEVAADLLESGLVLTGGAAQLPGIQERLSEATGLETRLATNPSLAAVTGAAAIFWPEQAASKSEAIIESIEEATI